MGPDLELKTAYCGLATALCRNGTDDIIIVGKTEEAVAAAFALLTTPQTPFDPTMLHKVVVISETWLTA